MAIVLVCLGYLLAGCATAYALHPLTRPEKVTFGRQADMMSQRAASTLHFVPSRRAASAVLYAGMCAFWPAALWAWWTGYGQKEEKEGNIEHRDSQK